MNENVENTQSVEAPETSEPVVSENFSANQDNIDKNITIENQESTEAVNNVESSFEKKKEDEADQDNSDNTEDNNNDSSNKADKDDDEEKKKYALLEEKYNDLEQRYTALQNDYQSLVDFKNKIEDEKKDDLIKEFYMLSDEDKKDVIDNKSQYSLDQIEAKLSIIYTKKKMASEQQQNDTNCEVQASAVVYNLNNDDSSLPDWVKAVRETEKEMNVL